MQLVLVFLLMLVGAIAEMLTLGALLPFLALVADPSGLERAPIVGPYFATLFPDPAIQLRIVTVTFVLAAILAAALRLLLAWASQTLVFMIAHDFGMSVFNRSLRQPYSHYFSRNSSELIADMDKVQIVSYAIMLQLMTACVALVISAFILVALVVIDPVVALVAGLGFGLQYVLISVVTRRRLGRNSADAAVTHGERMRILQEGHGAIRHILIDHLQPEYVERFRHFDLKFQRARASTAFLGAAPRFLIEGMGLILIAVLSLWLVGLPGGIVTALPVLGALALGAVRLLPMLQQIYNAWTTMAGNRGNLIDVVRALELPLSDQPTVDAALPFEREINFIDVGFSYPGSKVVLHSLNLKVPRGSRVGIVGRTGSGKSTLMDLLLGLLAPSKGRILIDDVVLDPTTTTAWQAHVAHVPQVVFLSDSSLAENIAFGIDPSKIDNDRLQASVQKAAMSDFVAKLPEGLNTRVGERGVRLSGGQRQRIGIARALYRRADVLVFDEATSALDTETETAVMEAIDGLTRELTIFLIAHRKTTLRACDMIIQLPEGELIDFGELE